MSVGMILLVVLAVLLLFGIGQRVLDRMRLNDKQALLFIALIFIGGWIPSVPLGGGVSVNIGGALIPFGLCVYLFIKAGTAKERLRAVAASLLSAAAVFLVGWFFPSEPEAMPFDINYLYGILAGVVAYVLGRSRISAFIAGVMGILLADSAQAVVNAVKGLPVELNLGGGGALDAVVVSGIVAVVLSEVVGELLERAVGAKRNVQVDGDKAALVNSEVSSEETSEEKGETRE